MLTPRQWQVLSLLREGLSNEQIALRLGISLDGVKFHVSEILGKLGVSSRNEAARWAAERHAAPTASLASNAGRLRRGVRVGAHGRGRSACRTYRGKIELRGRTAC